MKFKAKRIFCTSVACVLALSAFTANVSALELKAIDVKNIVGDKNRLANTKVYVVGDSTACIYTEDENYAVPRAGWAMYLANYLNDKAEVIDLALGGRSSKSFIAEPEYKVLKDNLKAGDYVIIQFGHNDAKNSTPEDLANRYTDPLGKIDSADSFRYNLYNNYIKFALDKGATPILLSPVSRRRFDEHNKIKDTHENYDDTVRAIAEEMNVPFIDMTKLTEEYYNKIGVDQTKLMHALYNDRTKSEGIDNTHFSHYGANVIAKMTAEKIAELNTGLEKYVVPAKFTSIDNNYITKGDFTALITRALSLEAEGAEETFADVPADYDKKKYIAIAKSLGIVAGNPEGMMGFSDYITRQEMAAIAYRAISKAKQLNEENTSGIVGCVDYPLVSSYAQVPLSYMIRNGYMDLVDGSKIAPLNRVTKEEAEKATVALYYLQAADIVAAEKKDVSIEELEKVETTK